jgi:hypothetical protein
VSILVQYLRIFPVRWFRTACFVILGLVVAYGTWVVSSSILICSPVAFSWDKSIVNGSCMNQLTIWVANAAVNIALDVVIFLMPLFVIRGLSISKSQKNGLRFMFALGARCVKLTHAERCDRLTLRQRHLGIHCSALFLRCYLQLNRCSVR